MDLNNVNLTGRLARDFEVKYTPSDIPVADNNLAVDCGYGEKKKTIWIGLVFWDKQAESAAKNLGKGRKVIIQGRLDQDEWDDKDTGKKQSKTRVVVTQWFFGDSQPAGERQERPAPRAPERQPSAQEARREQMEREVSQAEAEAADDIKP